MRICLIVPGFSAAESDWCIPALLNLARRLAAAHEVLVVALRYPHRRSRYRVYGADVSALGAADRSGVARARMFGRALAVVRREHRRTPFDLVHGLWADEAGYIATIAGRWIRRPSVVSVMGGELVGFPELGYGVQLGATGRWLVRHSLRRADFVTVGSRQLGEHVASVNVKRPVRWAPLGVDTELFRCDGEALSLDGEPRLLHVASLTPIKDQHTLIEALPRILDRQPSACLHLVGGGPLHSPLLRHAARLGIGRRVVLHGPLQHHDLPPFYRGADLHLTSSRFESQGMAALEAAACGTPTAGTAVGILPELGAAARTTAIGRPQELADAVLELVDTPERLRVAGRAALDAIESELSLDRCVNRLVGLYREAAGTRG